MAGDNASDINEYTSESVDPADIRSAEAAVHGTKLKGTLLDKIPSSREAAPYQYLAIFRP